MRTDIITGVLCGTNDAHSERNSSSLFVVLVISSFKYLMRSFVLGNVYIAIRLVRNEYSSTLSRFHYVFRSAYRLPPDDFSFLRQEYPSVVVRFAVFQWFSAAFYRWQIACEHLQNAEVRLFLPALSFVGEHFFQ